MSDPKLPGTECGETRPGGSPPGSGGNVVPFNGLTTLDIPADGVLSSPLGKLATAIVAGIDKDGNEYFASSYGSVAETLFLLERYKKMLLGMRDDE